MRRKPLTTFRITNLIIKFIDIFKNMLVDDVDYMFEKRMKEISKENFKETLKRIKKVSIQKVFCND